MNQKKTKKSNADRQQTCSARWSWRSSVSVLALAAVAVPNGAPAADVTWVGNTVTNWNNTSNWSGGALPTAADNVRIDPPFTFSPTVTNAGNTANNVSLGVNGAASLFINSTGDLSNSSTALGVNSTGEGSAYVSGIWNMSGALTIGQSGTGQLEVLGGGVVATGGTSYLGQDGGSSGVVNIHGAGSKWSNTGGLEIGYHGAGSIMVSDGGALENDNAWIGDDIGSAGTVSVVGVGSKWTNTGTLTVGLYGNGTLDISDGASVTNTDGSIAVFGPSVGVVNVSGNGTSWASSGTLSVGRDSEGYLNVSDGAVVTSATGSVGYGQSSTGVATLSGASQWIMTGDLDIGLDGTGTLNILSGAHVLNANANVGTALGNPAASGAVTVSGAGSQWISAGDVVIGQFGSGNVSVSDGGLATALSLTLGASAGSSGVLMVDGAGSGFGTAGALNVGLQGDGALSVTGGGTVVSGDAWIAAGVDSIGAVRVAGAGSNWAGTGTIQVGAQGQGSLEIVDGGMVSDVHGWIGSGFGTGEVIVRGAGSEWSNSGTLAVGQNWVGSLAVLDGGKATSLDAVIGDSVTASGTATISGAGSALNNANDLYVGYNGNGSLTVSNGGEVTVGGVVSIATQATSTSTLNIGAGSADPAAGAGTFVAATVQFGAGDGAINFNHTDANYLFDAGISGLGTINHLAGVTRMSGNSSGFAGTTSVSGGSLYVNSLLGGSVNVTGGLLGGSGVLGDVKIGSGGTVAPGNSIGTLTTANVTFDTGSVYEVEIDGNGNSDLIDVTGTATINGGVVDVVPFPDYATGVAYTILTAGTLNGTFDTAVFNGGSLFLTPTLSYDANNVYFTLAKSAFDSVALTRNQKAAAGGADSLGAGNVIFDAVLALADAGEARAAFDALSGEVHASTKTVLLEDSRFPREAAIDRLRNAFGSAGSDPAGMNEGQILDGLTIWSQGFGSWGTWDSDGNAAAMDRGIGGILFGGDALVTDDIRFGLLGGYSHSSFESPDRASSGSVETYTVGAYGGGRWDASGGDIILRGGAALSWHDLGTGRSIDFSGFSDDRETSYDARTVQTFGELAYGFDLGESRFEPFANLAYVNVHTDGFAEKGGGAALTTTAQTAETTFATLGLRGETEIGLGEAIGKVRGMLGYRHAFGDVVPTSTVGFTSGGSAFTVAGVPIAEDVLVLDAGFDINLTPRATVGLAYGAQFGSGMSDQSLKANLDVRF